MVLVKILGLIDLMAAVAFLMISFGVHPFTPFLLFCAGLLFLKGLFIITGEIMLSSLDLIFSAFLIISIFFTLPLILIWIPTFLLLAKAMVSFI